MNEDSLLLLLLSEKGFVAVISIFQASHLSGVAQTSKQNHNTPDSIYIYCVPQKEKGERRAKKIERKRRIQRILLSVQE